MHERIAGRTNVWSSGLGLTLLLAGTAGAIAQPDSDRVRQAIGFEQAHTLPVTEFFTPGAPPGAPGTLVRSEVFDGYELPKEVQATRIVYRSKSQLNKDTVASAVVVRPKAKAPAGGWPVLVWAHGTTGVARTCGPSLSKGLSYYSGALVKEGLARGFAVVVVDYSGMGAGAKHEYLWKKSNANDTAYAVPAARQAVPELAAKWVAIGHSQGGQTVWGVAEKMVKSKDSGYLGAVSLAPGVNMKLLTENVNTKARQTFYPVYMAYGIKTVYPQFDIRAMLQPKGSNAYERLTTAGCWGLADALFYDNEPGIVLQKNWDRDKYVQRFLTSNTVGVKPIAGPLFVASGLTDDAVPPHLIEPIVAAICKTGATVMYKAYPGDHDTMMQSSFEDQMNWIVDRFKGQVAPSTCQTRGE